MDRMTAFIEAHEGRRNFPYRCPAGKITIGVGRNVEANPPTLDELAAIMADGVPEAAIDMMRDNDIARARKGAESLFASFSGWPPARQAAVVSAILNLGMAGFLGFAKMVSALREGRWADAADALLDSKRALQLPRRSAEEARMIETGEWLD